jgi:hypothetical protein
MKRTQNQRLLAYLRRHRKGITTMEAFLRLGICRLSERIRELEASELQLNSRHPGGSPEFIPANSIIRTPETTQDGARVIRYKLLR